MIAFAPLIVSCLSLIINGVLTYTGHNDPSTHEALNTIAAAAIGGHLGNQKGTM